MVWVNQLINNSRQWQEKLVKSIFRADIATEILQTTISEDGKDSITWKWERNGYYSVASGYRTAFRLSHPPIQQHPEVCREKRVWNSLWELQFPPKVKVFLWKALHGGLPVRNRLHSRLQTIEDICPMCHELGESVNHCIFDCKHAKKIGRKTEFENFVTFNSSEDFWRRWIKLIEALRRRPNWKINSAFTAILAWRIWLARNLKIFEAKDSAIDVLYSSAVKLLEEFGKRNEKTKERHQRLREEEGEERENRGGTTLAGSGAAVAVEDGNRGGEREIEEKRKRSIEREDTTEEEALSHAVSLRAAAKPSSLGLPSPPSEVPSPSLHEESPLLLSPSLEFTAATVGDEPIRALAAGAG
ncbi:uncharacterized protein LOC107615205 [Arachis ipaensis]|uniref:Reverse transcriptase zinc-binding domain-containing protein n=1 Tax=Arachis hypogaea TaxID=3818 RepID=A0A444XHZ4_ARAHY|nr:uncharacterized protein LOC107615205 [Arachis ipaensis]XP_025678270.1 uncharacterized protein LOC112778121 [Arachis hypogaea]RYQ89399.1 hypothetical protein Ahy_B09g096068 [Arachis hypogaea]